MEVACSNGSLPIARPDGTSPSRRRSPSPSAGRSAMSNSARRSRARIERRYARPSPSSKTSADAARRGLGGRDGHVEAGLAIACFTHPASRELDPQLHTHGIVCNVAHGEDGRFTALDSRTIFLHRKAAGVIYRAELRQRVAALGGQWGALDRRGLSELEGFEPETLRAFSQRRNAIEAELEASGYAGRAASEAACLATRRDKVEVELEELRATWATRAGELGWDSGRVDDVLDGTDRTAPLDDETEQHEENRLLGPTGLTREHAAFQRDDVLVAWAEAHRQGATRDRLDALAEQTLRREEIVPLVVADEHGEPLTTARHGAAAGIVRLVRSPASGTEMLVREPRYSTADLLALESRILEYVADGQARSYGQVHDALLVHVLDERPYLSNEQAAMVRAVCGSGDAVSVVVGVPGSGKTFALEAARAAWRADGYHVYGAALAAEAAGQLEAGSKIESSTLDRLLYRLSLPPAEAGHVALNRKSIVVVDEASMIDTRRLGRLLAAAERSGAKVVLTGDDRQLPSIEAGGGFAAIARKIGACRLVDNGRQVEAWEREALAALREGRSGEAAGAYRRHGRINLSESPATLLTMMVERWWKARGGGDDAVLYAYTRDATRLLNTMARTRAEEEGLLSGASLTVGEFAPRDLAERTYRIGDELCCLRNRSRLGAARDASGKGVRNGTRGRVVRVDHDTGELTLRTSDDRTVVLPKEYVDRFTDYGYAWTLHKGQGQTVGEAARGADEELRRRGRGFIFGAEALSAEAALVAASRATDSTELYVLVDPDDLPTSAAEEAEDLGRAWARSEHQQFALEELEAQQEIGKLARSPLSELSAERDDLVAMIGPGPAVDLSWQEDDARRRFGVAIVQRDEAIDLVQRREHELAESHGDERRRAKRRLHTARRLRLRTERELRGALAASENVDAAIDHQKDVRALRGSDVRRELDRLEVVDSAVSTARERQIAAWAAIPPPHIGGLLGPQPSDRARALRWRQGLIEIEDWRRSIGVTTDSNEPNPWVRALGPPLEGFDAWRRRRVQRNLRAVRRDLGLETDDLQAAANSDVDPATAAVLRRPLKPGSKHRAPPPPGRDAGRAR